MTSGIHPIRLRTVCVRDDDERAFCFFATGTVAEITGRVSAALAVGRRVRCYALSTERTEERERRFLVARGYREATVKL